MNWGDQGWQVGLAREVADRCILFNDDGTTTFTADPERVLRNLKWEHWTPDDGFPDCYPPDPTYKDAVEHEACVRAAMRCSPDTTVATRVAIEQTFRDKLIEEGWTPE